MKGAQAFIVLAGSVYGKVGGDQLHNVGFALYLFDWVIHLVYFTRAGNLAGGGERIRTSEGLRPTDFRDRHLNPLGHASRT